ncbi:uncharacterized protein LOC110247471 isoform X2 [Exaiptasia diaphana]|uniref:Uncharacterized protein n=1 Tax=Exaiptasia diaphana TaxID=2652724 RepID=A0A913XTL3_EXADI|nr:uncharacterized protein LOC110247471 isoform X2 [Exaiptasia diaphana]
MDNMGSPTPDGTEGIVHVEIPKTDTDGISTDYLIGCIIHYKRFVNKVDSSLYGGYDYMLILPVNNNNNKKYEDIIDIEATFYNFKERKPQSLKLELEVGFVEAKQLSHQFLPCCMEDKKKRDKRTLKGPKSESEEAQSYVSKYSKTVGIDILTSREFCKQGNELFGIRKSDKTSRAKFVSLKFSKDEPGVLEKCFDIDVLHPCGILLHGIEGPVKGKYDVKVIGSYSLVDGKITYKLILDEVMQTTQSASNGQKAEAMNSDSVSCGSVQPSDSQPEDNQANANKTNKLGAVATNELNNTEGGRSGSSELFEIDECEPCALEKYESDEKHSTVKDEIGEKTTKHVLKDENTAIDSGATNGQNISVFSKDHGDKEKIVGKDLTKSHEACTSSRSVETEVLQLEELKKILEVLKIPLERLREGKSVIKNPEEMLKEVNRAQELITTVKYTKKDLTSLDAEMNQLKELEERLQEDIRIFHSNAEVEDQFGTEHINALHNTLAKRNECLDLIEEKHFSSHDQQEYVIQKINSICLCAISKIEDSIYQLKQNVSKTRK